MRLKVNSSKNRENKECHRSERSMLLRTHGFVTGQEHKENKTGRSSRQYITRAMGHLFLFVCGFGGLLLGFGGFLNVV